MIPTGTETKAGFCVGECLREPPVDFAKPPAPCPFCPDLSDCSTANRTRVATLDINAEVGEATGRASVLAAVLHQLPCLSYCYFVFLSLMAPRDRN